MDLSSVENDERIAKLELQLVEFEERILEENVFRTRWQKIKELRQRRQNAEDTLAQCAIVRQEAKASED